ncbi:MAG: hypothetical protein IKR86_06455 [Candidatus Methanomethylophilaceae archaeon]|nr:hypothetical protein [Candidatus Methanomethylophilaceae archaeon]
MIDEGRLASMMSELAGILDIPVRDDLGICYLAEAMDSTQTGDECKGKNHKNPRNARLALLGDSLLDFFIVERLYGEELSRKEIDDRRQKLASNRNQVRLLEGEGLQRFYRNSEGFKGDEGISQPASSFKHITYLEAIIGAVYLSAGMDRCRKWVVDVLYPKLEQYSGSHGGHRAPRHRPRMPPSLPAWPRPFRPSPSMRNRSPVGTVNGRIQGRPEAKAMQTWLIRTSRCGRMDIIALKCPECHGDLQLDAGRGFGFCQYCGTRIVIRQRRPRCATRSAAPWSTTTPATR